MIDLGHWVTDLEIPEDPYGFIYVITNTDNNHKYIGKKQCKTIIKRAPLKGKKRKRHVEKDTDWKTYTGSCNKLNSDIESIGKDKFIFEIIRFCNNKWELSYFEMKEQLEKDVLISDQYYNGIINARIGKIPNETRRILEE